MLGFLFRRFPPKCGKVQGRAEQSEADLDWVWLERDRDGNSIQVFAFPISPIPKRTTVIEMIVSRLEQLKEMEVNTEIKEVLREEKSLEGNPDEGGEINQVEERVIPMMEETEVQEEMTNENLENKTEVEVANTQTDGQGKVEDACKDSPKKRNQTSKHIHKAKVTVPKPFTLETEKRMSRERRGSMDFKESKLTLLKSPSLNYKNITLCPERTSDLKGSGSSTTKTSLKPKEATKARVDKSVATGSSRQDKVHVKEVEKKKPQAAVKKHEGNEPSNNKIQKNSPFKALPLPSFYHQEDIHSKLETKKVSHPKPPVAKSDNTKIEEKGKTVSGKIGARAKETISKLFRTTKSTVSTPKEKAIAVVSSA